MKPSPTDPLAPEWRRLRRDPEPCPCGRPVWRWDGRGLARDSDGWVHDCERAEPAKEGA